MSDQRRPPAPGASFTTAASPPSLRLWIVLGAILAAGGVLRFWGVSAGAPFRMGVDEPFVLGAALRMVRAGNLNPHFFDYGGVTLYLHSIVMVLAFMKGALEAKWSALGDVWEGDFLVASRTLTAVLGTTTIAIVYLASRRWSTTVALLAALTFAILPPHVRESHFALTDVPLTLAVALAWWLSLRAAERQTWSSLAAAAVAAGLCGAVKYNGGLAVIMPVLAVLAFPAGRRARAVAVVAGGTFAGFFIGAPYTFLDLPGFLDGFAHLVQSYNRPTSEARAASIYLGHMRNWFTWPPIVPAAWGYLTLLVGAVGAGLGLSRMARPARGVRIAVTLGFPLVYFWFVSSHGSLQYGRYLLPITPMAALVVSLGVVELSARVRRLVPIAGTAVLPACILLVAAVPTASAVSWNVQQARVTTTDQAARWLSRHAGNGEPVVIEDTVTRLPPRMKTAQVRELIEKTADQYRQEGVVYLVASSRQFDQYSADPVRRAGDLAALAALFSQTDTAAVFTPSPEHPGPGLRILQIRR